MSAYTEDKVVVQKELLAPSVKRKHYVNKEYVDAIMWQAVDVRSVGDMTLTAGADADTFITDPDIDGVMLFEDMRVLTANQNDPLTNDIWCVVQTADGLQIVRTHELDGEFCLPQKQIRVLSGGSYGGRVFTNQGNGYPDFIEDLSDFGSRSATYVITGDGTQNIFTITHGLNSRNLSVDVYKDDDVGQRAWPGVNIPDVSTVVVDMGANGYTPTAGESFRVVIMLASETPPAVGLPLVIRPFTTDGVLTDYTVYHGLGTRNLFVQVVDSTSNEVAHFSRRFDTNDTVTLSSVEPLIAGQTFRVLCAGMSQVGIEPDITEDEQFTGRYYRVGGRNQKIYVKTIDCGFYPSSGLAYVDVPHNITNMDRITNTIFSSINPSGSVIIGVYVDIETGSFLTPHIRNNIIRLLKRSTEDRSDMRCVATLEYTCTDR